MISAALNACEEAEFGQIKDSDFKNCLKELPLGISSGAQVEVAKVCSTKGSDLVRKDALEAFIITGMAKHRYGNDFDIIMTHIWDRFSRFSAPRHPHTRRTATFYLVPMLIGRWLVLGIRWCDRFGAHFRLDNAAPAVTTQFRTMMALCDLDGPHEARMTFEDIHVDALQYRDEVNFGATGWIKIKELMSALARSHTEDRLYGNDFDIILAHIWDHFSRISRLRPTPTRAVGYALLGAHADRGLIGAWNPML